MHAMEHLTTATGVHVLRSRAGEGTPVLLVHGQLCDHTVWGATITHLGGRRPVAALDLPAHGASSPPDVVTIDHLGRAIVEVIDALGASRVVAVGHSLGATALVRAALARPERFAGLMLVALPPGVVPEVKRQFFHHVADEIQDAFPARFGAIGAELWYSARHRARHPELPSEISRRLARNDPAHARAVLRAVADQPSLAPAAPLPMPALVVAMDEDRATPLDVSRPLVEALGAEVVHLPGAHFPFEEVPDAFHRCLDAFLERCP